VLEGGEVEGGDRLVDHGSGHVGASGRRLDQVGVVVVPVPIALDAGIDQRGLNAWPDDLEVERAAQAN
jgi:hypothetical protein